MRSNYYDGLYLIKLQRPLVKVKRCRNKTQLDEREYMRRQLVLDVHDDIYADFCRKMACEAFYGISKSKYLQLVSKKLL